MKNFDERHFNQIVLSILVLLTAVLVSACQPTDLNRPQPTFESLSQIKQGYVRNGLIQLIPDDLSAPILPESPTQADLGEQTYYQVCMACHGNWGQGLTDEWRETGFGDDMNCWVSKCHSSNHPPQGFEFPQVIPPLLGNTALSRLADAQQLYTIIYQTMPWWAYHFSGDYGKLSEEEALNLTAYLLRARGELPQGIQLTYDNLSAFPLHSPAPKLANEYVAGIGLLAGLVLALIGYIFSELLPKKQAERSSHKDQ